LVIDGMNAELPHYRRIRNFTILREGFTAENGSLTAMGKVRREAINARYAAEIAEMYETVKGTAVSAAGQQ
jgi:long-subunit acyl-CoA synthetase (AMP-forming)